MALPDGPGPREPSPSVSALRASVPNAGDYRPPARRFYEGDGGWNDGRLGQAYDLIALVIADRGEQSYRHPLLAAVEAYDIEGKLA